MIALFALLPDVAARETRTAMVPNHRVLPPYEFGFLEYYCPDIRCDCRRVVLSVEALQTGKRSWASINYGWETVSHYRKWWPDDPTPERNAGAVLDPLNPQSEYAPYLLELFTTVLLKDHAYVERLRRHYRLFKTECRRRDRSRKAPGA